MYIRVANRFRICSNCCFSQSRCAFLITSRQFCLKTTRVNVLKQLLFMAPDKIYRGSYISAHVLLNLLNKLKKCNKMRGLPSILSLFAKSLINSVIQEHKC